MNSAYPLAFLVGLLSTLHCVGMCGGLVGAMSYSLPAETRRRPLGYLFYLLLFNLGRIATYALVGALFGWLGGWLMRVGDALWLDELVRLMAGLVLVGIGLYIGGWFPAFAWIERLGTPLWRHLAPLVQRLLPVTSPHGALLFGAVWGWLPCGLVYSMLISAPAQGGPVTGALYLVAFGAGTLPTLLVTGLFAGRLHHWGQRPLFRSLSALVLIGLSLFTLYYQVYNDVSSASSEAWGADRVTLEEAEVA